MTDAQALKALTDAARAGLDDWPGRFPGYRAIGYLCSYVPEEMIHSAGFAPVRLRRTTAPLRNVDAHLQSFTCALCRSTVDQMLGGDLGFLQGTVFAHTCDTMQVQADVWRMNAGETHAVETVMQPARLGSSSRPYLMVELRRFHGWLASLVGHPISDYNLRASIGLYDETRKLVQALQEFRGHLSSPEFYCILDAAQAMPREVFNPLLTDLLADLESALDPRTGESHPRGPGLLLVGAVLDEPLLLDLIEEVGGRVVGDDLCSGSRHFRDEVGSEGDPIANLADYYLRRAPCPTKLSPDHEPGTYVLDQASRAHADGVVFALEKFCEPHAFEFALIRPVLDEAGLPHLLLEMEQVPSLEALRTRLQAFVEML